MDKAAQLPLGLDSAEDFNLDGPCKSRYQTFIFCYFLKKLKILVKHLLISQCSDFKNFDYPPACVTISESSTLPFHNSKAYIQFNFMHFRDGSV